MGRISFNQLTDEESYRQHYGNCISDILQIINIFEQLEKKQQFFPGAEINVWHKDDQGNISLNTASILKEQEDAPSQPRKLVSLDEAKQKRVQFYWGLGYERRAPYGSPTYNSMDDIKRSHAYLLGIHLQQYLTRCAMLEDPHYFNSDQDLEHLVLFTDIGWRFETLIRHLTSMRVDLQSVKNELISIQHSLAVNFYYKNASQAKDNRYVGNTNVSASDFVGIKEKYKNMHGDLLKTEILFDIKTQIDNIEDMAGLDNLMTEILGEDFKHAEGGDESIENKAEQKKSSVEYQVLEKRQGLFAKLFGDSKRPTNSAKAVLQMFEDKKQEILNKPKLY